MQQFRLHEGKKSSSLSDFTSIDVFSNGKVNNYQEIDEKQREKQNVSKYISVPFIHYYYMNLNPNIAEFFIKLMDTKNPYSKKSKQGL